MNKIIYEMNQPFSENLIQVYGKGDAIEWRLVTADGEILHDTENVDFGCKETALQDALMAVLDQPVTGSPGWLVDR